MRKKMKTILALSASLLGLGALTGCTKDDIKSLQDQVTALQTELDALKTQLASLQAKLISDIQSVKDDYNAKIQEANDKIAACEEKIQALKEELAAAKKALEDDYNAKISALSDQHDEDKQALEDDYNAKIAALDATYKNKTDALSSEIASLKEQISSLKDEMSELIEQIQADYNVKVQELSSRISALENKTPRDIYTGNGAPSSSLGVDGDSYVDLSCWDYYLKENGEWVKKGNLKAKDPITYVPCIFKNYDGTKIYEFYYEKGSNIVYDGPSPVKPKETIDGYEVEWTFSGWDKSLENIQTPTIFTAQYVSMRDCTFKNYDGTILYQTSVNFGESVTYNGETPSKPNTVSGDQTIVWNFCGWDKSLSSIKTDTVFTAQFNAPNAIKCTFVDYDGTTLSTLYCASGDNVEFNGTIPNRDDYNDNKGTISSYTFSGWDKSLKNITEDTVFTAQYGVTMKYLCSFVNYDDTVLYETMVKKGETALYDGETPVRAQEAEGTNVTDYAFSGWDQSLENVTKPMTFKANFTSSTFVGHKVTFMKGEEVLCSHYFEDGTDAAYPLEMPFDYDQSNVTLFLGWDKSLKNISADLVVNGTYKTISRAQNGEYPQTKVTDSSIIEAIVAANSQDKQGYYNYSGEKYCLYNGSYFKVEPIHWSFLKTEEGKGLAVADKILDVHCYNASITQREDGTYPNNWAQSDVRSWLNADFLNTAYYYDDSLLSASEIDNSSASTQSSPNQYACDNTFDKIFLLSRAEYMNGDYGFAKNSDRECGASDYAFAKGVYHKNDNVYYWTRSPYDSGEKSAWFVGPDGGFFAGSAYVNGTGYGIRPAINLIIS